MGLFGHLPSAELSLQNLVKHDPKTADYCQQPFSYWGLTPALYYVGVHPHPTLAVLAGFFTLKITKISQDVPIYNSTLHKVV